MLAEAARLARVAALEPSSRGSATKPDRRTLSSALPVRRSGLVVAAFCPLARRLRAARLEERARRQLRLGGADDRRANTHAVSAGRVQRGRALRGDPANDHQRQPGCGAHAAQ